MKKFLHAEDLVLLGERWGGGGTKEISTIEKATTGKDLKVNVKKTKAFLLVRELYQWKLLSFHVQFEEEEWEVTPFYVLNVTVGCIKNAQEYKRMTLARQRILSAANVLVLPAMLRIIEM